ncbi:Beta-tubulin folding cofactor D [Klebsormidium nitens]|uniref:Beta-tubulin folding cofactor D n=1 Tax=Klebsormidium nitens TaxID=105231 RepID=A0A1Y1IDY3_KLENI|nr:Beta-tubulin folding cofactor D [Klebsormidium nitens]|eukprot:GAQ86916.1 Beta-tubulin folding cofactor D [Klebsormidium nitens]
MEDSANVALADSAPEAEESRLPSFVEETEQLSQLIGRITLANGATDVSNYLEVERIFEKYQEQPQLLDPHLEGIVVPIMLVIRARAAQAPVDTAIVKNLCRLIHTLSTIRGPKTVVKLFPHQASDLEPTVALLELIHQEKAPLSILKEESTGEWESRCTLLLWLSMLVLLPFDLASIDTALGEGAESTAEGPPLVKKMVDICKEYLSSPGSVRDVASVLLARLLTRVDMRAPFRSFLAWSHAAISSTQDDPTTVFLLPGIMSSLAAIFKVGGRDILLEVSDSVWADACAVLQTPFAARSPLVRMLAVKLIQRIGLTHLPPRVATWRYQRGHRSLLQNMDASLPQGATDAGLEGGIPQPDAGAPADEPAPEDDDLDVPDVIEDVIEHLLTGLKDKDTVVRWSAAKGIGRVTGRLPADFADEVVGSVAELFRPAEGDGAWHGACLAVAELARRGLLLPQRLSEVVPAIVQALHYDVRRGPHSVGAHVRDAAAYVCWAFVRAYTPDVMAAPLRQLAPALLTVACYDREVNCRRAAAAAFQEAVGRQGNFAHGIEIVQRADYFSLGTRAHAYKHVAPFVAQFEEYRQPLIDHVMATKINHWEKALRELAAEALALLVPRDPALFTLKILLQLVASTLSADLPQRHGATLAVGEVLVALKAAHVELTSEMQASVGGVVPAIEKARLYRGKGGEMMRGAVCRLIERTAHVGLPLPIKTLKLLEGSILDNLQHPTPDIQASAASALSAFAAAYLLPSKPERVNRTTLKYAAIIRDDPNPAAKRGCALALGALPKPLLNPVWKEVLDTLCGATVLQANPEERDAETRVNAVRALAVVCETLGLETRENGSMPVSTSGSQNESGTQSVAGTVNGNPDGQKRETLALGESSTQREDSGLPVGVVSGQVMEHLLAALDDYATDNRGDVGSWVREAAMESIEKVTYLLCHVAASETCHVAGGEAVKEIDENGFSTSGSGKEVKCNGDAFTPELAARVIAGLAKQAAEKIDRVRNVAGSVLQRLLARSNPPVAAIPHGGVLRGIIPADAVINWAVPSQTFPLTVQLLAFRPFRSALLAGLVISVGGLADSLGKASASALLDFLQTRGSIQLDEADRGDSGEELLNGFADAFKGLFDSDAGLDRVIVPALKTLAILLEDRTLQKLQLPAKLHARGILDSVGTELRGCKDIPKLLAGVDVLCSFARLPDPDRSAALQQLLGLLGNRYPKVRMQCAEKLYDLLYIEDLTRAEEIAESLPAGPEQEALRSRIADLEAACDLLLETKWSSPVNEIKDKRDGLFCLLKVEKPVAVVGSVAASAGVRRKVEVKFRDENETYGALVDDAGY